MPRRCRRCRSEKPAFAIGFLERIWCFHLVQAEASTPYPLMMHRFYFGIGSMGIVSIFFAVRGVVVPAREPKGRKAPLHRETP